MQEIFPYLLKRPCILVHLISSDVSLKNKLNKIFSKVSKNKNKLDKEFSINLNSYSFLRTINSKLSEWYKEMLSKPLIYNFLKSELNFSFIYYLNNSLYLYYLRQFSYYIYFEKITFKGIVNEFYASLDNVIVTFLPKNDIYSDSDYFNFIEEQNQYSKEKNRIKQKIKLLLIIDENYFYNDINYQIKYDNICELELIFGEEKIIIDNIFKYFNNYLSQINHLENINKIIFHNKLYENYLTDYNNKNLDYELYQSLLGFLFDEYYSEENENMKYQIKLIQNLKEIKIENITFLYIYEKIKLLYCINDLFPSLNIIKENKFIGMDIPFYITNKILIINNKNGPLNKNNLFSIIDYYLNSNKSIENLVIINHNSLIKEEKEIDIKINLSNIKEFMYISEKSENNKNLLDKLTLNSESKNNKYEGYDNNNNLIFYREGKTHMQSFDLIDLFKYNKILTTIKFIKEQIVINYDLKREHLEILNINPIKNEINDMLNAENFLPIIHFIQFIYNQKNLKELTINKFDVNFNNIENNNVNILNINCEKSLSTMKYKIIEEENKRKLLEIFPNLINLNVGGNIKSLFNIQVKDFPKTTKLIIGEDNKKIYNFSKKFKKNQKEINIEYLEENYEEENEEEYEENEEEYEEYEIINNLKK